MTETRRQMKRKLGWMIMGIGLLGTLLSACGKTPQANAESSVIDGGKVEEKNSSYSEKIESTKIESFCFEKQGEYSLKCGLQENGRPFVSANGGGKYGRDGSRFWVEYETETGFLEELQKLTVELQLSKDNGHTVFVNGLPACGGESIYVLYESGERISRSNNQSPLLKTEESEKIYEAFHKDALSHKLDFTTEGSNMQIYNDADVEYLQGSWSGKHFGDTVRAVFEGWHVKIYINDKLTDDCDYKIVEGEVVPDRAEKYPKFSKMNSMRKSNDFTLTGYFYDNGSSTASLYKE